MGAIKRAVDKVIRSEVAVKFLLNQADDRPRRRMSAARARRIPPAAGQGRPGQRVRARYSGVVGAGYAFGGKTFNLTCNRNLNLIETNSQGRVLKRYAQLTCNARSARCARNHASGPVSYELKGVPETKGFLACLFCWRVGKETVGSGDRGQALPKLRFRPFWRNGLRRFH